MPIDFVEETSAPTESTSQPKIDFQEEESHTDKPDFLTRLVNALSRAPAAQREESQIETQAATRFQDRPLISPSADTIRKLVPAMQLLPDEAAKGASEELASTVSEASKPGNLGLIAAAAVAPEIVGGALAGIGAKQAGEALGQASVAFDQGNTEEASRLATRGLVAAGQAAIAPTLGIEAVRGVPAESAAILPKSAEALAEFEKGVGKPPISSPDKLLPAPRTRMPEFQDSTLGIDRNQKALPAPGESEGSVLLPESPLGPRTAGYRIKVPPFEERPIVELDPASPEAVDNLKNIVQISGSFDPTGAEPFKSPEVSTDLRQLQGVMQRNTVSTLEAWADKVIKDKMGGASSNPYLDPEFLSAAVVKGTVLIKRGATDFAKWSAPMVAQFGRDIIPHLESIYKNAKDAAGEVSAGTIPFPVEAPNIPGTDVKLDPSSADPIKTAHQLVTPPVETFSDKIRNIWRSVANEALPNITTANREVGEAGVRSVTSTKVGRDIGDIFAGKVLEGLPIDPVEFGAFAAEDNLRWREADFRTKANEAIAKGDTEDAQTLNAAADAVGTLVGAKGSPFKTHDEYMRFWERPEVQQAAERHRTMWAEQKDPLYRQANDLDPETPLASRGLISGMRVNMKGIQEGDKSPTAIPVKDSAAGLGRVGESEATRTGGNRSTLIRQMATLKKNDPFNRTFTGLSPAYEADYGELMRNGFGREMPIAAQHEFIRKMIDNGEAVVSSHSYEPDLTIRGEPTVGRLLTLRPWADGPAKFLQVRRSHAQEYDNAVGLTPNLAAHPLIEKANNLMTRASVAGLAEGTTHQANLLSQIITGPGPTSNPLINGLLKAFSGRADLLYSIPRVFTRAMKASKEEIVDLVAEGAAKEPYSKVDPSAPAWKQTLQKASLGHLLLDPTDKGVRLVSKDLYDNFAKAGWIPDPTETGRREFINQVGNYNRALQPVWMRFLRDNVQPFATAVHTFNVAGVRRLAGSAGIRDLPLPQRLAFAADIYGGWVGFITLAAGLNWMLNHNRDVSMKEKIEGPTGTKLGEIGWLDAEGKLKTINLARIAGYERGLNRTGILPAMEAMQRGLSPNDAMDAAGNAIGQTAVSYLTGPAVHAGFTALTGKTPSVPSFQDAPIQPPQDEFSPFKTQMAANIGTAAREANPLIDSAISLAQGIKEGHSASQLLDEAGKKQLTRYYPGTKSSVAQSEDFSDIVRKAKLNEFVEDVTRRSRKLPEDQRRTFIEDQIDAAPEDLRRSMRSKLKQKGAFKPEK